MTSKEDRRITERTTRYRSAGQLDRDRVQYSTAFSRLAEVTQVVSADHGHVFHNRLTHSLKVAQLARRLTERLQIDGPEDLVTELGGLDPDVAEAAALAHDLGHPPFGHVIEEELNELATNNNLKDGFEGNAQSFRIVNSLAVGDALTDDESPAAIPGLNLTRGTLNALLKYPWFRFQGSLEGRSTHEHTKKSRKWGAYQTEAEAFAFAREGFAFASEAKCLEAEIMDWADDITYAVHDLVDFYGAGRIPMERLKSAAASAAGGPNGDRERESFLAGVVERHAEIDESRRQHLGQVLDDLLNLFPLDRRYDGTLDHRRLLWCFMTELIGRFLGAFSLCPPEEVSSGPLVAIKDYARDDIFILKELTWHYVILSNDLACTQHGQKAVVREVFETLREAAGSKERGLRIFPRRYREELEPKLAEGDEVGITRTVIDYIAGMSERELLSTHATLTGRSQRHL